MRERVAAFGPEGGLVGVECAPASIPEDDKPVVLVPNSGIVHHVGMWRLHTRVARRLAEAGFTSFRFDLSGIGDSQPSSEALPVGDVVVRDLAAAASYAQRHRRRPIVVLGLCSGGRDALELAIRDESVVGTFAIDLISDFRTLRHDVEHFRPRLLSWSSWQNAILGRNPRLAGVGRALAGVGPEGSSDVEWPETGPRSKLSRATLRDMLTTLVRRDVRMFFAFSNGLEDNYNHAGQFASVFPSIASDERVSTRFFPDADHTFSDAAQQAALLDTCVTWVTSFFRVE